MPEPDPLITCWHAYLTAYLDPDTYAQVKDLSPDYLRDLYNLTGAKLFDTTFNHIDHLSNFAHDLPHITRTISSLKTRRMDLAMIYTLAPIADPNNIADQLMNMRSTPEGWRNIAKDLSLLYDFYRLLDVYTLRKMREDDRRRFETVLNTYSLPDLFAAIGKTRRQQEDHTWIWRENHTRHP